MDRASLHTPLSWAECVDAVASNRLEILGRSAQQQVAYHDFIDLTVKAKYSSIEDYLLESKFGLICSTNEEGKLVAQTSEMDSAPRTLVCINDFPYHYEEGIVHYILWKLNSPLTQEEIKDAEAELSKKLSASDTVNYINPVHLKSVLHIEHAHILVRLPPAENSLLQRFHHLLIPPTHEGLERASSLLSEGLLLAFPTETVYGLGANALNEEAVLSIFKAKGRPLTDPLIVHVTDERAARNLLELSPEEDAVFRALSKAFWPGPLTIIAKAETIIPPAITANTGFVGVRVPAHPLAMALLQTVQLPIAAPSANRFGHVSPTRASHVLADLAEKGVHVLNGEDDHTSAKQNTGSCQHGIESTVAKIDGPGKRIVVFRQGAVTQKLLEETLLACDGMEDWHVCSMSRVVKMEPTAAGDGACKEAIGVAVAGGQEAPGQAITHYAPDVPCFTVSETSESSILRLTNEDVRNNTVVIDFHGRLAYLAETALAYRDLSASGDSRQAARKLFDYLRWAECVADAKRVLLASIPVGDGDNGADSSMSLGLQDRMFRACSGVSVRIEI